MINEWIKFIFSFFFFILKCCISYASLNFLAIQTPSAIRSLSGDMGSFVSQVQRFYQHLSPADKTVDGFFDYSWEYSSSESRNHYY